MRLSTQLLINVVGFAFNLSMTILFALLHEPLIVGIGLVMMFFSYQRIYHFMQFLDACECTLGEENEDRS